MNKECIIILSKSKIIPFILSFLLIINIGIPVKAMLVADDLPQQSTFAATSIDFKPFDAVQDKINPILYISDADNKQIIAYNFETNTKKILHMETTPKKITINNNELFVCLSNDAANASNKGAVAIIDTATFNTNNLTIKDKFDTEAEPVFINVDKNNYIYVYSGTPYEGTLTSYNGATKSVISSVKCHGNSAVINNTLNKLYLNGMDFNGYAYSTFIETYSINNNGVINKIMKNNDTDTSLASSIEISPDDKYVISGTAAAYLCSEYNMKDLILGKKLQDSIGYFRKAAFDLNNKNFYLADELQVKVFDEESLAALKAYKTNYNIDNVFYFNNKIITLTHDENNKNYIEISAAEEVLKRPYLIKSSVKHDINIPVPNEFTFEFNEDIFIKDVKGIKLYDYLRGTDPKNGTDYDIDVSTAGNKLIVKTLSKIGNLKNLTLDIEYSAITDKNGQPLSEDIYTGFSTKAEEDNSNKVLKVMDSTKIISNSDTIDSSIVVGKDATVVVDPGVNLKVNGDIIVYGKLVNLGNLDLNGKVYALKNIEELVDNRDKYNSTYFGGENSSINSEVSDKFPSPILYMNPSNDKTINSSNTQMNYVVIPDTTLIVNGEYAMYTEKPAGTIAINNMKNGDNKVVIETRDEANNVITKDLNIKSTLPSLNIKATYPEDTENYIMPINQQFFINFGENIAAGDGINKITITDNDNGEKYPAYASVINDENGNPTMLSISPDIHVTYAGKYTLNVPYYAVKNSAGSIMAEDYEAKFSTGNEFTRLEGKDRYETSIKISQEGWASSSVLILASGENFPDALSAGPLAKKYNAPVLLSESKELRSDTEKEIDRLNPNKIFIIGGNASISKEIEDTFRTKGIDIERISGQNRYATSMKVAEYVGISENNGVVLASGENFPDALSIAPYAASNGIPIILTQKDKLPDGFMEFINKNIINSNGKVYIVGGTGVISKALEDSIPFEHQRFSGKDRYETNFEILSNLEFDPTYSYFSSGLGFADALSGCALAAFNSSPIILVDKNMGQDTAYNITRNKNIFTMKYILGGEEAVPQELIDYILN